VVAELDRAEIRPDREEQEGREPEPGENPQSWLRKTLAQSFEALIGISSQAQRLSC
jgi:hypothetical protein